MVKYSGTICIEDGKITVINIKAPEKQLMEIEQVMAMKKLVDEYLIDYEKSNFRRM